MSVRVLIFQLDKVFICIFSVQNVLASGMCVYESIKVMNYFIHVCVCLQMYV